MSEFTMTAVFGRNDVDFHTITLNSAHNPIIFMDVLDRFATAGYEILSVIVNGYDFENVELVRHIKFYSNLAVFFEALYDSPHQADMVCAFITVNDCADVDNWTDRVYFSGGTHEEVVRSWATVFHKVYEERPKGYYDTEFVSVDALPSWMDINWESTLENIASKESSVVTEFGSGVYYFSND